MSRASAMFRKILLVYEESGPGERAFDYAINLALASGGAINIASIVRASEFALDFAADTALESACGPLRAQLAQLERRARFTGVEVSSFIVVGHHTRKILDAASEWRADLIITAEIRPGLGHWLSHSASRTIMTRAPCAVLMVR